MQQACVVAFVVGVLVTPFSAHAGPSAPLEAFGPGLWTVELALEGQPERWRFLVDTGSSHTVISTAMAARAGLPVAGGSRLLTPAGLLEVGETDLPAFRIGSQPREGRRVQVAPLAALGKDARLDGILGMDALGGTPFVLDLAGGALRFLPAEASGRGEGLLVPARPHAGRVVVEVAVDGETRAMVLDSGAQMPVVFEAAVAGAPVTLATAGGRRQARVARAEWRVGPVQLGGVLTVRTASPAARTGSDGLLPVTAFSRVFIDPARGEVRVAVRR